MNFWWKNSKEVQNRNMNNIVQNATSRHALRLLENHDGQK